MSGKKQHYIPQSLLKGFAIDLTRKVVQVVAYSHDRGTFTTSTEGIGAKGNFYYTQGNDSDGLSLDDKITRHENEFNKNLRSLRQMQAGGTIPAKASATFVTHLTTRNDHFRQSTTEAFAVMLGELERGLTDPIIARRLMGIDGGLPDSPFERAVSKFWTENQSRLLALGFNDESIHVFAKSFAQENFQALHTESWDALSPARIIISAQLPETTSNAQRKALSEELIPDSWVDILSRLVWTIQDSEVELILPDCVAVGIMPEGTVYPLMLAKDGARDFVLVPISTTKMLIGSLSAENQIPSDINRQLAGCSWNFFVANRKCDELLALQPFIRANVRELISSYVDETIPGLFNGQID
jgi:hypothetical protein